MHFNGACLLRVWLGIVSVRNFEILISKFLTETIPNQTLFVEIQSAGNIAKNEHGITYA